MPFPSCFWALFVCGSSATLSVRFLSCPGAVVSPGDGKVTDISVVTSGGVSLQRISIFLNVFNVHVNRSPIGGVIREVRYQRGKFLNAMSGHSAEENEQNIVTVEGEGRIVVFKQIAGLIARRIVFNLKVGDHVARGQRVGLIKFGSRVDVVFDPDAAIQVKIGDHVKGGATVLAVLPVAIVEPLPVLRSPAGCRAEVPQEVTNWNRARKWTN